MTDNEIVGHFERLGYRVAISQIRFTTESVDDFRLARPKWFKAGGINVSEPGLLIIEDAQPKSYQKQRDIVVVSLGYARAVMGVEPKKGAPPMPDDALPRYAATME
ncbi:MAG: hypothetical protein HY242_06140 [Afipia sp.]|nr:hypothetical protein [Afipia sp.]